MRYRSCVPQVMVIALAAALACPAVEVATGQMLGSRYDKRSFYVRERGRWLKTYSSSAHKPDAAGKMMNLRIAQALFHDEWLTEAPFDPDAHTNRVIEALDSYRGHGVLAISVSLQGGNMAYERSAGRIARSRDYKLGEGKGALVSAFQLDGSLKPAWMNRCLRLARALDERGMILNLLYLYSHQSELFEDTAAIDRAVVNATDWLIDNNVRNVIIEIANEYDINSWGHDRYVFRNMDKLIELARSRFKAKRARFRLPITASTTRMRFFENLKDADLAAVHGNNMSPAEKRQRMAELMSDPNVPGPVYMNEDNNGRETTLENLGNEIRSCDVVFEAGGSWGYMPWIQLQIWPFRNILPGNTSVMDNDTPESERDAAYFKAVLEHIRDLVFVAPRR